MANGLESSSSESSESIESDPERQFLIPSDTAAKSPNYKSTATQRRLVESEDEGEEIGTSEEEVTSKSVLAIISLLLIGTSPTSFREKETDKNLRGLHIQRRWHTRLSNLRHHLL